MILCFSGTGNSRYVADKLADLLGDCVLSINDKIKTGDNSKLVVSGRLVFVFPTYAWRIPRVVRNWISKVDFRDADKVWYVMTCGDSCGNAEKYNKRLSKEKEFRHMGTTPIVMPENYIAMFNSPSDERAKEIIAKAEPSITEAAHLILEERPFPKKKSHLHDSLESGILNSIFYSMALKSSPFYAKDTCTGCGLCEKKCPLNNISIRDGKPVWNRNCTHCMACIAYCPAEAIEYGTKSVGKNRYHL